MAHIKNVPELNKAKDPIRCKKIKIHTSICMALGLFVLVSLFTSCQSEPKGNVLYVAVNGDDNSNGTTIDKPLRSVQKALELIQHRASKEVEDSIEIILREGVYQLTEPIIIDNSYSFKSLKIKANMNEKVIISGGKDIGDLWIEKSENIWEINVENDFNQLFSDDQRLQRARWPNKGEYLHPEKLNVSERWMTFSDSVALNFTATAQTELVATGIWHFIRQRLESVDTSENTIVTKTEIGPECSSTKVRPLDRIYFENNIEFLDSEGEWFLNKDTNVLSMFSSSNPNENSFYYPAIETLFHIKGEKDKSIANLNFEGLTFEYTTWNFPEEERKGIQAGFWGTEVGKPVFSPPAALMMTYTDNSNILNCHFKNLGEGAIALGAGVKHTTIDRNTFTDIGSNVIQIGRISNFIGEGHPLHLDYKDESDATAFNSVLNNHLYNITTVDNGGIGVLITYSNNNKISHNLIEGAPYTGISVGWRWGNDGLLTNAHHNEISYNHIRNCMEYLGDGGAIYTVSNQPGTIVTHNWIHSIGGGAAMAEGIYTDQGSGNMTISDNYVYDVQGHDYVGHKNLWETMTIKNNGCDDCENTLEAIGEIAKYSDFGDNLPPDPSIYGIQNKK